MAENADAVDATAGAVEQMVSPKTLVFHDDRSDTREAFECDERLSDSESFTATEDTLSGHGKRG